MTDTLVTVESPHPAIQIITLNRPDKRNALSISLMEQFSSAMESANTDDAVRAIVITGAGPVFCAGLDLTEARDPDIAHQSGELVARALRGIMQSPKTTIAAVRGAAVAGGAGFMLACDLSVVADDFKTGFTEVRRGLVAGLVMTFLRRKVPESKARELLILGDFIGAEEALACGMVSRVVPVDRVLDEALVLAHLSLKSAPGAVRLTKKLFDSLYDIPVDQHLQTATDLHKDMRKTDEAAEGLASYTEKRLPNWDPGA